MLLGRSRDVAVLGSILDEVRVGRGATVVVRGEPGIGKTRLAEELCSRAGGFEVLRARGWELESQLPFVALADLLQPLLPRIARLPAPRAAALSGALGLGPPAPGDRFAVYLALAALLGDAAADRPLLVVVDDAQWLDLASCDALAFASRRLATARVMFLAIVRNGSFRRESPLPHAVDIELGGIDVEAAAGLLAARAPAPVDPDVARRLHAATGGNPLALSELGVQLTPPQLAGRHPVPDPLPLSQGVATAFVRRAGRLSEPARRLLVLVAAAGGPGAAALPAAARASGLRLELLEEAERAGLLVVGAAGPMFRHPLMRSAVYFAADPHERRAAHRLLAEALVTAGPGELRAWHLAAAALAPDEETAGALERAADRAAARSAYPVAASTRERAADLSPSAEARARRLLGAAHEWMLAGRLDRAAGLANGAAAEAVPGPVRDDARRLAGRVALHRGSTRLAAEILLAEADAAGQEPARVAALLSEAVVALIVQGDMPAALSTARRAAAAAAQATDESGVRPPARAALGAALVVTGSGAEGAPLLAEYAAAVDQGTSAADDPVHVLALRALVWAGEPERAEVLLARRIAGLRGRGALGHLGLALATQLEIDLRAARWRALSERADEVLALARETGQGWVLHTALRDLATVAAAQGREEDCRALVEEMGRMTEDSDMASRLSGLAVLGLMELGLGRAERAVAHLEEAAWTARGLHGVREPNVRRWSPDLVEACVNAGRPEAARRELELLEREARASASPWSHAVAARCRGMLAPPAEADRCFGEALVLHGPAAEPFERARTELALGERRRRLRRRAQAREPLESALATFTRLGATPWVARARAELAAAGGGAAAGAPLPAPLPEPAGVGAGPLGVMTPQERRLAALVVAGATNREVAASVHLSTKTVEEHLSRLYRKLGVRSRTELTSMMVSTRGRGG